jgi:hypothetical protein
MLLLTYNRERKKSEKWAQKRMKKEEREARRPGRQEHGKEEKKYVHFLKVDSFETLMMCVEPVWKEGVFLWAPFLTDSTPRPKIQNNVGKDVKIEVENSEVNVKAEHDDMELGNKDIKIKVEEADVEMGN